MSFLELAKERYSCRKYTDQKVEKEKIDQIIEAAIAAPTANNQQPFKLFLLESEDAIAKVNETTNCIFGCRTVIAVGGLAETGWVRASDGRPFADVDASIVGTHILLAAHDLGLGSCWVGWFDEPKFRELFPETAGYDMVGLFPIGYPAEDAHPAKLHTQRKDRSELVEEL